MPMIANTIDIVGALIGISGWFVSFYLVYYESCTVPKRYPRSFFVFGTVMLALYSEAYLSAGLTAYGLQLLGLVLIFGFEIIGVYYIWRRYNLSPPTKLLQRGNKM